MKSINHALKCAKLFNNPILNDNDAISIVAHNCRIFNTLDYWVARAKQQKRRYILDKRGNL